MGLNARVNMGWKKQSFLVTSYKPLRSSIAHIFLYLDLPKRVLLFIGYNSFKKFLIYFWKVEIVLVNVLWGIEKASKVRDSSKTIQINHYDLHLFLKWGSDIIGCIKTWPQLHGTITYGRSKILFMIESSHILCYTVPGPGLN